MLTNGEDYALTSQKLDAHSCRPASMQFHRLSPSHNFLFYVLPTGPAPCFLLCAVLENGKTMKNGRKGYAGCIRHALPLLCAHGALGRHLCARFSVGGAPFPDPEDLDDWLSAALWPGRDASKNISYRQQADNLKQLLGDEEVFIRKLTHAFRVYTARAMDEAGVSDQVRSLTHEACAAM